MSKLIKMVEFPSLDDERGSLVAIESIKNVPFDIKRVYYIFGAKTGVSRGYHAHKELKQVAVCVSGKCRMILDDGINKEEIWLDSPNKGILIEHMIWREIHDFSSDCVLLLLASKHYDENDYVRDYRDFMELVGLQD